ncbi:putative Rad51 family DNA repair protein [Macrophomina phaseolina]|uniref:Rad51 family DNA repair protein n=1 Tax=Macrophomina phaseolina TaxID=35725 RepID=A0ABQ8GR56_9PEZI|nr:putative Rad51 family DNA repair protein [Macrophomina phaseolina]
MGAEAVGRRLLGEVEEAGLDEILRSVRASAYPELHSSRFGIRPLDRLLHLSQQQTAQPLPPHNQQPTAQASRNRDSQKLPLVELTSVGPGQGKTQLIYLITAIAILPRHYDGIDLRGKNSAVVIIDTDGRFSVPRLLQVARCHVHRCIQRAAAPHDENRPPPSTNNTSNTETLIADSLSHVHIIQPQSHASLLSTLRTLPSYLSSPRAHPSSHRPLHSIILDSASAFFWPLRAAEDDAHAATIGTQQQQQASSSSSSPTSTAYADLVAELRALAARLDAAVVATTASVAPRPGDAPGMAMRPLLPPAFTNAFALVRLGVRREGVQPFAPAMSVREAQRERAQRQGVVEKGGVGVWVDGWGAAAWGKEVREAMEQGAGRWRFVIRAEGVWVEEDVEGEGSRDDEE